MSITVQNLTKQYGTQKAVNEISFTVNKGEIVGFLGPNGAGKSTTMKIITGYLQPDGGRVEVCGTDVVKDPLATKKKIGYLPESNPLYYDMYIREYLGFVADVHGIADKKATIEKVIVQVGLTPESSKKIGQLSKGYKQRVGLAAALLHDPEVLILDEPTTGLDPNQIIEIREVIRTLGKNKTVLFSSHILQEVEALCNRVVIINKGNLVADSQLSGLLNTTAQKEVTLQLKEEVDPAVFAAMAGARRNDPFTWVFPTDDPDTLRRQLLELCLQKQLNIVALHSEQSQNLEAIFRQLTQNPAMASGNEN